MIVWLDSIWIERRRKVVLKFGETTAVAASLFHRFLAFSIDALIIFGIETMASRYFVATMDVNLSLFAWVWFGNVVLIFFYFWIFESIWSKTPGKWILGLRVVSNDGQRVGWVTSLIRNVLRILDSIFYYLIGAIFFSTTKRHQRLGDLVAKTFVIRSSGIPKAGDAKVGDGLN